MELDRLKWWHWVLLSLPLGWLLAYVNSATVEPTNTRTDEIRKFQQAVMHPPAVAGGTQIPWIRNLIVYPPAPALGPGGKTIYMMPVTYDVLVPLLGGQAGEYTYEPSWFGASIPFEPWHTRATAGGWPPGIEKTYTPDDDATLGSITAAVYGKETPEGDDAISLANYSVFGSSHSIKALIAAGRFRSGGAILIPWNPTDGKTVRDWLDACKKDYPWVQARFAWWKVPRNCQILWMSISFMVVGVFWPITIRLLTGAGLSVRRVKAADYDLSRFGTGKETSAPRAAHAELDAAGREKLATMNASLTASLAADATHGGPKAAAPPAAPTAPGIAAKTLAIEPVAAAPPEAPKEHLEYGGEFYPVAKGPVKKNSEEPPQPPKKP